MDRWADRGVGVIGGQVLVLLLVRGYGVRPRVLRASVSFVDRKNRLART